MSVQATIAKVNRLRKLRDDKRQRRAQKQAKLKEVDTSVSVSSDWVEDPLPLPQFLKEHMNIELWPRQQEDLELFLGRTTEDVKRLFTENPPTPYNCGILCYGKGSGKDYVSAASLAWFVYILLCLRHPQVFLGLAPDEAIDIALASPTLRQTRKVTFTKFKNRLKGWDWLAKRCKQLGVKNPRRYVEKATEAADYIELPNAIRIHNLPLDTTAAEGFNLIAFILSEYAGMESDAKGDSATKAFETFQSSAKTRFGKAWKGFIASFPRSLNDPQEQLISAYEAGQYPELFVVRRPTWEVNPSRPYDTFAGDFERNPEDSWARYGAQPRAAVDQFFRSPELIVRYASGGDYQLFKKYFHEAEEDQLQWLRDRGGSAPDPVIERDSQGDALLNHYGFPQLHPWVRGLPGGEYFGHIDVGLSRDSAGYAIGHLHVDPDNPNRVLPIVDLMGRWRASHFMDFGQIKRYDWHGSGYYHESVAAAEVDLKTITEFFLWLKTARGFTFEGVTVDGFNSAQLKQDLLRAFIQCELHVVDKKDFDELKSAVYTRQLSYRCDRTFFHECAKLEIRNGKVEAPRTKTGDKRQDSHKDVADCVAAVAARMIRLGTNTTEYITIAKPEDVWEQAQRKEELIGLEQEPDVQSEMQRRLMREFFDE